MRLLIGNTWPLALTRRRQVIEPITREQAHLLLAQAGKVGSYWGHANTLAFASAEAGRDITPDTERPALLLDDHLLPTLDPDVPGADMVLVLSPQYRPGYRPAPGVEAAAEDILGWQWLLVEFTP